MTVRTRADGRRTTIACNHVISSMPLPSWSRRWTRRPPAEVLAAAKDLRYRDFLTVALVVPESVGFPDNWIYIHTPAVEGRPDPELRVVVAVPVKDGRTCLGLEYFVNEGDDMWTSADDGPGRARPHASSTSSGWPSRRGRGRLRRPGAEGLPGLRRGTTSQHVEVDRGPGWPRRRPNVHPVGRNGMHKYNNQDHSMLTAMLTAREHRRRSGPTSGRSTSTRTTTRSVGPTPASRRRKAGPDGRHPSTPAGPTLPDRGATPVEAG